MTHLSVSAHDHLLASEHDVGGPLQPEGKKTKKSFSETDCIFLCGFAESLAVRQGAASYPSRMDSLQQYRLSNFCLVTESLTFMAGTHSFPALES